MDAPSVITLGEAALLLKEAPAAVFSRITRGELPARRQAGRWLIERQAVERLTEPSSSEG